MLQIIYKKRLGSKGNVSYICSVEDKMPARPAGRRQRLPLDNAH